MKIYCSDNNLIDINWVVNKYAGKDVWIKLYTADTYHPTAYYVRILEKLPDNKVLTNCILADDAETDEVVYGHRHRDYLIDIMNDTHTDYIKHFSVTDGYPNCCTFNELDFLTTDEIIYNIDYNLEE